MVFNKKPLKEQDELIPYSNDLENRIEDGFDEVIDEVNTHEAEIVSQNINVNRDVSLEGIQTINTGMNRLPKRISVLAVHLNTNKVSISLGQGSAINTLYTHGNSGLWSRGGANIIISNDEGNSTQGVIENTTPNSFDINWSKVGNGATGTVNLIFTVLYHGE